MKHSQNAHEFSNILRMLKKSPISEKIPGSGGPQPNLGRKYVISQVFAITGGPGKQLFRSSPARRRFEKIIVPTNCFIKTIIPHQSFFKIFFKIRMIFKESRGYPQKNLETILFGIIVLRILGIKTIILHQQLFLASPSGPFEKIILIVFPDPL